MVRPRTGSLLVLLMACGDPVPPAPGEDVLVLELGAPNASLEQSLRAVAAKRALREDAPPPVSRLSEPPPESEPESRTVWLVEGQTISELAQTHLGSSRRWHEILELNGWTEDDARRLGVGTPVRLPAK